MAENDDSGVQVEAKPASPRRLEKALKSKSTLIILGAVLAMVAAVMFTMPSEEKVKPPPAGLELSAQGIDEQAWQVRAQARLQQAQADSQEAKQRAEITLQRLEDTNEQLKSLGEQLYDLKRELAARGPSRTNPNDANLEETPVAVASVPEPAPAPVYEAPPPVAENLPPPPPLPPGMTRDASQVQELTGGGTPGAPGAPVVSNQPVIFTPPAPQSADSTGAKVDYEENPFAGYLPAGSFAKVVLLTGLDAGAGQQTRANPQPVLLRVQNNAQTPGGGRYQMKNCFLIGSAYGDLSAERAYIRLARLSCVDTARGLVLETDISGYISDSDGFQGLRGKLVRRTGQLLAKAILAGFADGIAQVAGAAASTQASQLTTFGSGVGAGVGQQADVTIDTGGLAKAGAFGGAANAAGLIAEYYLNEAQNIFPVISVPPGRKGSVVITEGSALKWASYKGLFVKKVSPER